MIIGVGTDIVKISRVEELIKKHTINFIGKIFSTSEIANAAKYGLDYENATIDEKKLPVLAAHLAKRFAAKEAFSKAVGTGIGQNVAFTEVSIINDDLGRPKFFIDGGTLKYLEHILAPTQKYNIHVSLSDDTDYAVANVIIEAIAKDVALF